MSAKKPMMLAVAGCAIAGVLASACSSPTNTSSVSTSTASTTTTTAPTTTSTGVIEGPVSQTTTPTTDVNVPLAAISDPGLPSQVGVGPLKTPIIKQLMQFFENKVSLAFQTGSADALDPYLAGSMLTGNKATINVLNAQGQRNVYQINVTSISLDNNEADRAVFDMKGNMVTDYFENTKTNQPVANGLPGPSSVDFLVFLDFNPSNHTWYWTGEQNLSNTASGASSGASG